MADTKRRILLVDDEPSVIKMVKKRLEIEGFEVSVAVDGEEAITKANAEHPDLVILDLMLPKLTGFEVCERLKGQDSTLEIPIVTIFTGRGREGDEERLRKLGAAAYVTKGKGAAELLEVIHDLLGTAG